jgi:ubiquinone/menaquinone biosynthesis C-methylase UbiE
VTVPAGDAPDQAGRRTQPPPPARANTIAHVVPPGAEDARDRVRSVYRAEARSRLYDALTWLTLLGRSRRLRGRLVECLGLEEGNRVLDIGCGTGLNLAHLRAAVGPGGEVVGIDLTPEMLDLARSRGDRGGWRNVELRVADAARLPFEDGSFDGACSTLAFSVIPEWERALGEAWRVLRPGGSLAVLDASALRGRWRWAAPIVHPLYRRFAAWNPEVELAPALAGLSDGAGSEQRLGGLYTIAWAHKPQAAGSGSVRAR